MILVDTSIWIDHLRAADRTLVEMLEHREVLVHPVVLGEVALGSIADRDAVLGLLRGLPAAAVADDEEVLALVERRRLAGSGIGWADAQLVAATLLTPGARLWSRDPRLAAVAGRLGIALAAA